MNWSEVLSQTLGVSLARLELLGPGDEVGSGSRRTVGNAGEGRAHPAEAIDQYMEGIL